MNNIVALCALLAASVAAVAAYDFEDPEFNQVLAQDLDDIYDSYEVYSHPRSRRDEEAVVENDKDKCRAWKRKGKLCCGETVLDGFHEKDKELKRTCFKELYGKDKSEKPRFDPFKCDEVEKRKKEMTCVVQCIGQKRNLLDADGNLKEEEFDSFVKEGFSLESWLTSLQDKIISTCLDEAKNSTANRDASDSESCNPAGVKAVHCLFREIQLNCPAAQIKDERSCARLQERIKSHDFLPPPPPGANDEPDN